MFNPQPKNPQVTNPKYISWVKTLDACDRGIGWPADDAHHIIGHGFGGTGMTADDYLTMPMTRGGHTLLHDDPKKWESHNQSQVAYVMFTLNKGLKAGKITMELHQKYYQQLLKAWDTSYDTTRN